MADKKAKAPSSTITLNKKAKHDYFIEDRFEAGLVLEAPVVFLKILMLLLLLLLQL